MPSLLDAVILGAYVSVLIELSILHVPSVASSLSIWSSHPESASTYSERYRRVFELPKWTKLLLIVLPLAVIYGVYAYPLVRLLVGPDPLQDYLFVPAPMLDLAGAVLIVAGRAVSLASVLTIRRQNAQTSDSFRLHTSGTFRWSRNPGLVGMYLFVCGVWITMPSATMLAGIAFYMAYMDFKVRMEEDFLKNKFGRPYLAYQLRTGRYIT